jgi:hypothetical protein
MKPFDAPGAEDLNEVYGEIRRLGLESNLAELEAYGFTILERLLPEETVLTARQAILDVAERHTGHKPDLATGALHPYWRLIPYLLPRHEVFEHILMEEKALALVTYLVGKRAQLYSMTCHFKGPGADGELPLHCDSGLLAPLPPYSAVCNVNYAIVDYTRVGGCLAVVPGSHRYARQPTPMEAALSGAQVNPSAIPIEVPAGTAVIWHGNTWHGSFARMIPGLRLNLAVAFARPWMKVQEQYGSALPQAVIARHANDARFRQLVGLNEMMGWKEEGPAFVEKNGGFKGGYRGPATRGTGWHS